MKPNDEIEAAKKYIRVKNFPNRDLRVNGDTAMVIREYIEPASEWSGKPEISMIVVVNSDWPMPLHLQPHQWTSVPAPAPVSQAVEQNAKALAVKCHRCGNPAFYGTISGKWMHVNAGVEMDHEVVLKPTEASPAVAKVEGGDGLPPKQLLMKCGHSNWHMLRSAETGQDLYCEVCDSLSAKDDRISDLHTEIERLKRLLREVDLLICDHVSCDVFMEGPHPYLRKKQELANKLHSLGIKIAAVTGE